MRLSGKKIRWLVPARHSSLQHLTGLSAVIEVMVPALYPGRYLCQRFFPPCLAEDDAPRSRSCGGGGRTGSDLAALSVHVSQIWDPRARALPDTAISPMAD